MRKKLWVGVVVIVVTAGLGLLFSGRAWNKTLLSVAALNLDLSAPDALVRSKSLSRLPADLLRVPILHDLLSEDFLFYYENSEERLGLSGTLRRISYEHDVTLTDELIKLVLDEPADVALWRSSKGTLKYYAIAMTRNKLAKLLEPAAKIALNDKQLAMVGEVSVGGDTVQLFALEYAWNRKMLLASHGDRVVLFSDPGMVLNSGGEFNASAEGLLSDLLGTDVGKQQRFAREFDLGASTSDHSIAVKANFLSFSYQHFFPALRALRFDFSGKPASGGQTWSTAVLLDVDPARAATLLDGRALWSSLPYQPGACVAMPVDWQVLAKAMDSQAVAGVSAEQLAARFKGPVAACWYGQSRLHTPLFVAQLDKESGADAVLESYFNYSIRNEAKDDEHAEPVKATSSKTGDVIWHGAENGNAAQPTLARSGKLVYFSPDATLVEQGLAVAHKRQPALNDSWPDQKAASNAVAVIGPGQLAQLAEHEVAMSLPQEQDEVLRSAAERHLLPKLAAVKKYAPLRLEVRSTPRKSGWVSLDWK